MSIIYYQFHPVKAMEVQDKVVEVVNVKPGKIQQTVTLLGTVKPKHATTLVAESTGLLDILVNSGEKVNKGVLIAKLVNPDIEKNYNLSLAAEKLSHEQYLRFQEVKKPGIISAREIEEKKQAWLSAQKETSTAKIQLKTSQFYAPFTGVIGLYKKHEGAQINHGDAVVSIYDPSVLRVDVDIPCTNIEGIRTGQTVKVNHREFKLTHVQKMLDEDTHMCPADIDITCNKCVIGSSVVVELVIKEKRKTLVIPEQAIFLRNGKSFVYKVVQNKVELVPVEIGLEDKNQVEIIKGLNPGDQVISKSPERIFPGMMVGIYQNSVKDQG